MKKCTSYETRTREVFDETFFGNYIPMTMEYGVCLGTKECDECTCEGNEAKCDFYPEKIDRAMKSMYGYALSDVNVANAVGKIDMQPNTLTITNCETIKMHHKEMDVDLAFDTDKLENIDTIVINGYKYVKEK